MLSLILMHATVAYIQPQGRARAHFL